MILHSFMNFPTAIITSMSLVVSKLMKVSSGLIFEITCRSINLQVLYNKVL